MFEILYNRPLDRYWSATELESGLIKIIRGKPNLNPVVEKKKCVLDSLVKKQLSIGYEKISDSKIYKELYNQLKEQLLTERKLVKFIFPDGTDGFEYEVEYSALSHNTTSLLVVDMYGEERWVSRNLFI